MSHAGHPPDRLPPAWRRRALPVAGTLVAVTVLQRFAVPGTGGIVGVGFLLGFGMTAYALGTGTLRVDPDRLVLYAVAVAGLLVTMLVKWGPFSHTSFLMLATLYLPFVAALAVTEEEYRQILGMFQDIMAVLALAGLLQFASQFVVGPEWMFPFDLVLPDQLLIANFNLRIPLGDDLPYLKSTGLFFLEPSHFSQFLALAIVIELIHFRRLARLGLLGAAYLTSFSGTGLVLLLVIGLPLVLRSRQYWVLAAVAVGLLLMPWLRDLPFVSLFLARAEEFDNPMSSGSMRFFGPYRLVGDVLLDHPKALLFGFGPGMVEDIKGMVDYEVLDSSWLKLLVEYGLIGSVGFLAFYGYVLFASSPDRLLSLACLTQFLLLGGYLNSFYVQFLYMALVGWPRLISVQAAAAPLGGMSLIPTTPWIVQPPLHARKDRL